MGMKPRLGFELRISLEVTLPLDLGHIRGADGGVGLLAQLRQDVEPDLVPEGEQRGG